MKKLLFLLSYFFFLISSSQAEEYMTQEYTFDLYKNPNVASIRKAHKNSLSGAFTVPSEVTYKGEVYQVTEIGQEAFYDKGFSSLTVPEGVTRLFKGAFAGCSELTSVSLPSSLKAMDEKVFNMCRQLTSITLPEGLTSMGTSVFENCPKLQSVTFPSTLPNIPTGTFLNCKALTEVHISEGMLGIDTKAFENCDALTTIEFPTTLHTLQSQAFFYCKRLSNVVVQEGFNEGLNFNNIYRSGSWSVTVRCADVPTAAEQQQMRSNTDGKPMRFLVPGFAWGASPMSGSAVEGGSPVTLAPETNGLRIKYKVSVEGTPGAEQYSTDGRCSVPAAATEAQSVTIVAEGAGPAGMNDVVVDMAPLTLQYTVRGRATFETTLAPGNAEPLSALTLPATTDQGLGVTYKVNNKTAAGSYTFPKATADAQKFTVVATAQAPDNVDIVGTRSRSYVYTVRGQRSFTDMLTPRGTVAGEYQLTLPATTSNGLTVTYQVAGAAKSGSYTFPAASTAAQKITVVATAAVPSGLEVDLVGSATRTYPYTVRGRRTYAWTPDLPEGAVPDGARLTLPGQTSDGLLLVTYTVNGSPAAGEYTFRAQADAQTITVEAQAELPAGVEEVDIAEPRSKTLTYTLRGQRPFQWEPSGVVDGRMRPGDVLMLPATTDNGLLVTYKINGSPCTAATYPMPAATATEQLFMVEATAQVPDNLPDVDIEGAASVTYLIKMLGERAFDWTPDLPAGAAQPGDKLTLPAATSDGLLLVTYTVNGSPAEGQYTFQATEAAQTFTVVAQAELPEGVKGVTLTGEATKTLQYTVRGQRAFEWTPDVAEGTVTAQHNALTLPTTTSNGLQVTYTVNGAPWSGATYPMPMPTEEAQHITVEATAAVPESLEEVDLSGEASRTYHYTVRGQRAFAWEPDVAEGTVTAQHNALTLPASTSNGLQVTYTVNGAPWSGTTYPMPSPTEEAQYIAVEATAALPDGLEEVDLAGAATKTYHYTVRGQRAFEWTPEVPSESTVAPGSQLTLPATTSNGLLVSYTVNGAPVEGSYTFPAATRVAQSITLIATAQLPWGLADVDLMGAAPQSDASTNKALEEAIPVTQVSKTYHYTVAASTAISGIRDEGFGISENPVAYDLSGRPVREGRRGLVIVNGKLRYKGLGIRD